MSLRDLQDDVGIIVAVILAAVLIAGRHYAEVASEAIPWWLPVAVLIGGVTWEVVTGLPRIHAKQQQEIDSVSARVDALTTARLSVTPDEDFDQFNGPGWVEARTALLRLEPLSQAVVHGVQANFLGAWYRSAAGEPLKRSEMIPPGLLQYSSRYGGGTLQDISGTIDINVATCEGDNDSCKIVYGNHDLQHRLNADDEWHLRVRVQAVDAPAVSGCYRMTRSYPPVFILKLKAILFERCDECEL